MAASRSKTTRKRRESLSSILSEAFGNAVHSHSDKTEKLSATDRQAGEQGEEGAATPE
jgi:hypothetical protein